MTDVERIARSHYETLDYRDRLVALEWVNVGHSWSDALIYSGVLSRTAPRVSPYQAARDRENDELGRAMVKRAERFTLFGSRRQAAEHEAAHLIVGQGLGLDVKVSYVLPGGTGRCLYEAGTPFQTATIALAGETWIGVFRSQEFPGGPTGCESDIRAVWKALPDDWEIRRAHRLCCQILRENTALVLAISDHIEADGCYVP